MKQKKNRKTVVITSGYFDPLHIGHIECFRKARKLGDELMVIVNTDHQARLKKDYSFMPQQERKKIIESLKFVDKALLSIDKDMTQCETLKSISLLNNKSDKNKLIFAKGGDRFAGEIPEANICKKYGIKIVDGLGKKIQSSSELVKKMKSRKSGASYLW